MKVSLIGFSRFQSKKGSECLIIGIAYSDPRWNGLRCDQKFVAPALVNCQLVPGSDYELSLDLSGTIIGITPCK